MVERTPGILFVAVLAAFGGVATLNQTVLAAALAGGGAVVLLPFAVLGAVFALVQLVAAVGLMRMDTWARPVGIAAFAFALVLTTVVSLFGAVDVFSVYQAVASVVAIGVLYANADAFGRGDRSADDLSPHVGR